MKAVIREWVRKAEDDYAMMEREGRARKHRSHDGIYFHAQQCAEKYLKARLVGAGMLPAELGWEIFRRDLGYLSDFAVAFRYPGESATEDQAKDAVRRCREFRLAARKALHLGKTG